jgi:hypothetical protein
VNGQLPLSKVPDILLDWLLQIPTSSRSHWIDIRGIHRALCVGPTEEQGGVLLLLLPPLRRRMFLFMTS